mmetsp:Transcript_8544/g.11103  ORF Transcript_8544/g.11103 Transcript_8544/m.11103 type:complete len:412 (-) Transcript_8544:582-1817(-)
MGSHGGEYLFVSVPNKLSHENPSAKSQTWNELQNLLDEATEVFKFDIPQLRTGTLDRLMSAADNLVKVDMAVEQVIRKIERQFADINENNEVILEVEEQPTLQYLETFSWNSAKYPTGRQIDELIKVISQHSIKLEDELKESALYLQEKKQAVQFMQRKKLGNLTIVDLGDILTAEVVAKYNLSETEYLKDIVVVVPSTAEASFLESYENLAQDSVGYGQDGDRESVRGSPVVPGSARKITEDKEGYGLYMVTILKNFEAEFKRAALSVRCVVREFQFKDALDSDEEEEEEVGDSLEAVESELNSALNQLRRWCKAHYGEAFGSWVHIKAIRVFVESALRYGIPANFAAMLIKTKKSNEKKVRNLLHMAYSSLDDSGMMQATKEERNAIGGGEDIYPYVSFDISAFGSRDK